MTGREATPPQRGRRLRAWLLLFIHGRGGRPVGFGCASLILALVLAPGATGSYTLIQDAEWLSSASQHSVTGTCEARMLRLTEIEVRVGVPEASTPVVLAFPDHGVPLKWWPTAWEECGRSSAYLAPIEVRSAVRPDGTTVAVASRDLPDLLDGTWFWTQTVAAGLFAAIALAWGVISWRSTRARRVVP